ncbi:sigma-70 family RNA polymerase sigma factor [Clostridium algidicarnis]|uniref:sigma-70 family RNA polymerase sigma factor n=1 Tax=Clostridium algidicarnis TaxID=37659 RepID=UPI001C0D2672|nr:sigma-70 family RNA polymerase sigma factor [Clostridium algidicarnis]MBU3203728.1 sigma-70 family RNA polymerase sigma factor [Clostridium algidicarnis]MBU3211882.1 sigma-70 family RNA polymerase sigma factor [Clostridium algidicarnis]MBU3221612.1 sigma-70 family RNA polymerase sigma factor [Clostridium algidicarnis]
MTNEELVSLYQQGDNQVLETLIEQNKGIVYKLVNKFYIEGTSSIDKEDLEQEGFMGLMVAAKKYDLENTKKAQFITYAVHWIYQKISRYIKYKNTNEEISLNTPIGDNDGDMELMNTIEGVDYGFENVEEQLYIKELHHELDSIMKDKLSLKEQQVLKLRHGWDNDNPMTLRDIGEVFNISGSAIGDIESRGYRKIRSTPWGYNMAKTLYYEKYYKDMYSYKLTMDKASFADKYLCGKVI